MSTQSLDTTHSAHQALAYATELSKSPRGSTTAAEAQAAGYVHDQIKSLGIPDVHLEPFSGERSLWLFIALVFGIALVGHAAYWLLSKPAGELPALIVAWLAFGFSGYLILSRFTQSEYPLHTLVPHGPSNNVIARLEPDGEAKQKLVLMAHLDTHRAVFWFATDLLVRIFPLISLTIVIGVFLAIPVYGLAALTHWPVFTWLGVVLVLLHFIGWFTGVTADLGRYSPGANDNASSVGTLLALAGGLQSQPLQNTELWLAFTGCEETSGDGTHALIKQHGVELRDALFIDLEMVGIGDRLNYIHEEGNLRRLTISPEVEAFVKEVGAAYGLKPAETPLMGASTECSILWKEGYKAVCLIASRGDSSILPEWHRLTDTPDRLQVSSLERAVTVVWELLQRFDQRLA